MYEKGRVLYWGIGFKIKGVGGVGNEKGILGKLNFVLKYFMFCCLIRVGREICGWWLVLWMCFNEKFCVEGRRIWWFGFIVLFVLVGVFFVLIFIIENWWFEIIIRVNFILVVLKEGFIFNKEDCWK